MPSTVKSSELVVAAGGKIQVAPFGTTLPTNVSTTLNAAFVELGYVSDQGVTFTATPTVVDIGSWQTMTAIRRIVTARTLTAACQAQQWNQETVALAFGGGTWTMAPAGTYNYVPPADGDALSDYSVVIDVNDGTKDLRWVLKRVNITDAVTVNLVNNAAALLPLTFSALTPDGDTTAWYFSSSAAGFSLAS